MYTFMFFFIPAQKENGEEMPDWYEELDDENLSSFREVNTVKTLNIGTPRLTIIVVLNIKQFNFTMQ